MKNKYLCSYCGGEKIQDENKLVWNCEYCQSKNKPSKIIHIKTNKNIEPRQK